MGKRVAWLNLKCLDLQTHGVARLSFFTHVTSSLLRKMLILKKEEK